jgi:hypothetical protein
MTEDSATAKAQAVVSAMRVSAREHKRLEGQHRREARRIMEARQQLIDKLRAAGIEVIIDEPEASSHGHRRTTSE